MASEADDIEYLMQTRQVSRAIARKAYADAGKAAKRSQPKGFAALDRAASRDESSLRDAALALLDEPERQPAAVAALDRVKKESKLPLAACRAALAQAGFDAERALAILATRPPARASGPNCNHSLIGFSGTTTATGVLLAQRRQIRAGWLCGGNADTVRELARLPWEHASLAHFANAFWVGNPGGVGRWDGTGVVPVAAVAQPLGSSHPVTVSARTTLVARSAAALVESTDGETFATVATAQQIGGVIGTHDVFWAK